MTDVVIGVPEPVAETLARLTEAVGRIDRHRGTGVLAPTTAGPAPVLDA